MPKELRDKDVEGQLQASTKTVVNSDTELEEFVNLTIPPQVMEEKEVTSLTLIGLSQFSDPGLTTFNEPPAVPTMNQGTIATVPTNSELSAPTGNATSSKYTYYADQVRYIQNYRIELRK